MRKKLGALLVATVAAAGLVGCTPADPVQVGTEMCADKLQHEIEQAHELIVGTWSGSKLDPGVETTTSRGGAAYDVSGTAHVTLEDGTTLPFRWSCFTQTTDGKTHAAVQYIDGECSTARRQAGADDC